jgi:hypothetical protein
MTHDQEWGNISLPGLSDEELYSKNWNKVAAGKENAANPKFMQRMMEIADSKRDNPEFAETMSEIASKRRHDPEYMARLHEGIAQRDNTYQAECNAKPEVREKISKSMKKHEKTPEHLAKVAQANRSRGHPVMTPSGPFPSVAAAGAWAEERGLKLAKAKLHKWLKRGEPGFSYLTWEEYDKLTAVM